MQFVLTGAIFLRSLSGVNEDRAPARRRIADTRLLVEEDAEENMVLGRCHVKSFGY